jgi:hypothetical protein
VPLELQIIIELSAEAVAIFKLSGLIATNHIALVCPYKRYYPVKLDMFHITANESIDPLTIYPLLGLTAIL